MRGRQSHGGFSLTEILMAAAILGVGMTMVASVFPVAVDQSRQSVDATMAALSARSAAAMLRARRDRVLQWCRDPNNNTSKDGPINLTTLVEEKTGGIDPLPDTLRCYNPQRFLYPPSEEEERAYDSNPWRKGSYVPVVFATPMNTLVSRNRPAQAMPPSLTEGPWRITILICKSRGTEPDSLGRTWKANRAGAGGYIVHHSPGDPNRAKICRGEAYMVSRLVDKDGTTLVYPASLPLDVQWGQKVRFYGPARDVRGYDHAFLPWFTYNWLSFPDAVAAYHTVLGD